MIGQIKGFSNLRSKLKLIKMVLRDFCRLWYYYTFCSWDGTTAPRTNGKLIIFEASERYNYEKSFREFQPIVSAKHQ